MTDLESILGLVSSLSVSGIVLSNVYSFFLTKKKVFRDYFDLGSDDYDVKNHLINISPIFEYDYYENRPKNKKLVTIILDKTLFYFGRKLAIDNYLKNRF